MVIIIGSGKNFDLRVVDKVGYKVGFIIGLNLRLDGCCWRFILGLWLRCFLDNIFGIFYCILLIYFYDYKE